MPRLPAEPAAEKAEGPAAAEAEALREQLGQVQGERERLDAKVSKHKQVSMVLASCCRASLESLRCTQWWGVVGWGVASIPRGDG